MPNSVEPESFIPLRKSELIDLLCAEEGMSAGDVDLFRRFCKLVSATFHFQYNAKLDELKGAYAPFDPDADTQTLINLSGTEKQQRLNQLLRDFAWLLEQAGFRHLSRDDIEPSRQETSGWGLPMEVNFAIFEHLAIFVRGDSLRRLGRRRWRNGWRLETTDVPSYQRLVLILKLRQQRRLPRNADSQSVYLKVFKDIPKLDIKMLLPSARVRLTKVDRGKIGLPFLSGILMAFWNMAAYLFEIIQQLFNDFTSLFGIFSANPVAIFWGITTGAIGYGTRSYFAYQGTRQRYNLTLTESLYFQNLDSNAGVLFRLLDEAEEQAVREAILGYYFLWRYGQETGLTSAELDARVELYLERYAHLRVDFQIGDALQRLEKMNLVGRHGDRVRAFPLTRALEILDWGWEHCFDGEVQP